MNEPLAATPSLFYQGEDESVAYSFDWSNLGTPAIPVSCTMELMDDTDVTLTNLSGAAIVVGDSVTTPLVISLTKGTRYRLKCIVTMTGNTLSSYIYIQGTE